MKHQHRQLSLTSNLRLLHCVAKNEIIGLSPLAFAGAGPFLWDCLGVSGGAGSAGGGFKDFHCLEIASQAVQIVRFMICTALIERFEQWKKRKWI